MAGLKRGLGIKGQGLDALINNQLNDIKNADSSENGIMEIDIGLIEPNKNQPRKIFDENALWELSNSIKVHGVLQPILLKKTGDRYEIIAGERRWRASKIAGLKKIPAIVKEFSVETSFEISLIENIQREDLNPIEEAESYKKLTEEYGYTQDEIAKNVGKSRSVVTNTIRLLNLDDRVIDFLREMKITNGHGRALLALSDNDLQFEVAEKIIEENLNVRQVERLVQELNEPKDEIIIEKEKKASKKTKYFKDIEDKLKNMLGTRVKLSNGKNKGKIEIEYYSEDDLDRLICIFNKIN